MNIIKKISLIIIVSLIVVLLMNTTETQAYSGEIDPEEYITLPTSIPTDGKESIGVSNSAGSNYSLYYQKVDITVNQWNQISSKNDECIEGIEAAYTEYAEAMEEENEKIAQAEEEANAIINDDTKTAEEKAEAEETYNQLYEEYEEKEGQLYEEFLEKREQYIQEFYSIIPNYTESNWKQTTDGSFQIDLSQYSGNIYFVLWAKLVTSEGTYYDCDVYSTTGTKEITLSLNKTTAEVEVGNTVQLTATTNSTETITWTSNKENIATVNSSGLVTGIAEGTATITAEVEGKTATCTVTVKAKKQNTEPEDDDGLTWTDFSNAKVRLVRKDYRSDYYIVVSDATFDMDTYARYDIYFSTDKNSVPDVNADESSTGWRALYKGSGGSLINTETELAKGISQSQYELSGDKIYVWVREKQKNSNGIGFTYKIQLSAVEVDRLPQSPLGTRITGYFFDEYTSIFLWDYYEVNNKNVKYKIEKVTDTNILKAIMNGEAGCLDKLLNYAKNASGGYEGTCNVGDSNSILSKLGLVDDAYYYVYFELDTENGKFYPLEDISLYQASCYTYNGKYTEHLYNYLDDEFVWNLSDEPSSTPKEPEDTTTSTEKIPNAGKTIIVTIMIISITAIGIISYKKYRNLKGI